MRPCARYVRRRCFCAWLTWMCDMNSVSTSRPFTCARHRSRRMSAAEKHRSQEQHLDALAYCVNLVLGPCQSGVSWCA